MRQAVAERARARSRFVEIPAPVHGLVLNRAVARPDRASAEHLENWFPTQRGIRVRGGLQRSAYVTDPVVSLFSYAHPTTPKFFAATADAVYDITSLDAVNAPVASIAGQSAGYYGTAQIGTVGGEYLYAVNGSDLAWLFDGSDWNPVNGAAVNEISYDALTADFTAGETLTGGTSGATAEILAVIPATSTTGVLKLGAITSGPYQDNETITSAGGSADADGANSVASSIAITGVTTSTFSHVWKYRNRLFFVEKNTKNAWYLPVDLVGGTAQSVGLAGVFQRGAPLLFGATWSIDSGDGLDDKCVFVSSDGEVAIYEGADPSSTTDWRLVGRYDLAKPLGIKGHMQAGGDLLIATVNGIIPLSQVVQKDPAALSMSAVSAPIEPLWNYEAQRAATGNVELVKWTDRGLGLVTLPDADRVLVVNIQTGGWGYASGWEADCGAVFLDQAYIGRSDGRIMAVDETGLDDATPFTAKYCHAFSGLGGESTFKQAQLIRCAFFAPEPFEYRVSIAVDYTVDFPSAPNAVDADASTDYLVWDSGNWDEKLWWSPAIAEATLGVTSEWVSVTGAGYALAPMVQITSGSSSKLNIELVRVDLAFEVGGAVV